MEPRDEMRQALAELERVREHLRKVLRSVEGAQDRVVFAIEDAGDWERRTQDAASEMVHALRRVTLPGAADLLEAGAAVKRALAHAERALVEEAGRDRSPGSEARRRAAEVLP